MNIWKCHNSSLTYFIKNFLGKTHFINYIIFSEHYSQFNFPLWCSMLLKRGNFQPYFFVSKLHFSRFQTCFLALVFTNVMKRCLHRCESFFPSLWLALGESFQSSCVSCAVRLTPTPGDPINYWCPLCPVLNSTAQLLVDSCL